MLTSSDGKLFRLAVGVKIVFEKEKLFVGPFERVLVEVASLLVLFEQDIPIDTNSLAMMLLIHS